MSEDILLRIKAIKQGLLNNAFLKLVSHSYFKDTYREFGEGSFDAFCLDYYRGLEQKKETAQAMRGGIIAQPIDETYYSSPDEYSQKIKDREIRARNMLQVNYEPPLFDEKDYIISDLHLMWHLYDKGDFLALSIEGMCLDLSFAKLLRVASSLIAKELTKAEWVEPKNRKTTQTKRGKIEKWQSFVLAIYKHGTTIAPETRLSKAIEIMQGQFEESKRLPGETRNTPLWGWIPENMKAPSRDSIISLFKKEGVRDRDFEKRGRYWFKKM